MPIMARTSSGIYKTVTDIYDTQGNAISKVYDTQGNVVFKKDNVIHLSFPDNKMSYSNFYMFVKSITKTYYVPLVNCETNEAVKFGDVKGKRIIITGTIYNYAPTGSGNTDNHFGTMSSNTITESTNYYNINSNVFGYRNYSQKVTYDSILNANSPDDNYLCIKIDCSYRYTAQSGYGSFSCGSDLYDDPQII